MEQMMGSVDPPTQGGGVEARAPIASVGGSVGLTIGNAWDTTCGMSDTLSDLREFLSDIEANPELKSAANLRAIDRLRDELVRVPETAGLSDPIVLSLQDAVLIARQLLQRLR